MTPTDDKTSRLTARLAVLQARLDVIGRELVGHDTKDWGDLALERESDEVLEELGLSGHQEIRMIKAALARIDSGNFGICTKCGNDISAERLNAVPFTPFCRSCAA